MAKRGTKERKKKKREKEMGIKEREGRGIKTEKQLWKEEITGPEHLTHSSR